jgi:hypothetical protein
MSVTLVMPIAGENNRFSGVYKWKLVDPVTNLPMLLAGIAPLMEDNKFDEVLVFPLKSHYDLMPFFFESLVEIALSKWNVNLHMFPIESTRSQPETVYKGLVEAARMGITVDRFLVKDCDNQWNVLKGGVLNQAGFNWNYVVYANLSDYSQVHAQNKAYIEFNGMNIISNIVEKKVISDNFVVGGYGFSSFHDYQRAYLETKDVFRGDAEFHLSHLIYGDMLVHNARYYAVECKKYLDWGTLDDWNKYLEAHG